MLFTDTVKQALKSPLILQTIGKLDAVIREHGVDVVRHGGSRTA